MFGTRTWADVKVRPQPLVKQLQARDSAEQKTTSQKTTDKGGVRDEEAIASHPRTPQGLDSEGNSQQRTLIATSAPATIWRKHHKLQQKAVCGKNQNLAMHLPRGAVSASGSSVHSARVIRHLRARRSRRGTFRAPWAGRSRSSWVQRSVTNWTRPGRLLRRALWAGSATPWRSCHKRRTSWRVLGVTSASDRRREYEENWKEAVELHLKVELPTATARCLSP